MGPAATATTPLLAFPCRRASLTGPILTHAAAVIISLALDDRQIVAAEIGMESEQASSPNAPLRELPLDADALRRLAEEDVVVEDAIDEKLEPVRFWREVDPGAGRALTTPSIADLRARRRLHHLLRLGDDLPPHRLPRPAAARRGKTVVSETAATSPGRQHLDPRPRRARAGDVLGAGPDGAQVACRHDCEGVPPRVRAAAKGDGSASSALLGT